MYASAVGSRRERLRSVSVAAEEVARRLNLGFEVVRFKGGFSQIYVYYACGEDEVIPIYCDEGKVFGMEEICVALRNMMFVLSFHPRHSVLKQIRKRVMKLS